MDGSPEALPEGSPEVLAGETDNVKVAVRCRPLSAQEIAQGHTTAIAVDEYNCTVEVKNPANKNDPPKVFTFDEVFGPDSQQMTIYNKVARPIVENVLKGYNGTIFAYGQTGTGKTFTMSGEMDQPTMRGIIPNSFVHICDHISKSQSDKRFIVRVSYLEIYNEEIRDLLAKDKEKKKNIDIRESPDIGVFVQNLSSVTVDTAEAMYNLMKFGSDNRQVGSTNMNENSSRSHAVFTVTVECSAGIGSEQHVTQGKLHLVDLAGSERQSKTGATGERLKEASKINLSLSTLGRVISALVDKNGKTHIPYRVSKLTRLLQDSLGGNSKTVMIANVGPATYNYDETISTLRYANRAKDIKNVARINEDPKDALMRKYLEEIDELKKRLENDDAVSGGESEEEENAPVSNAKPIPMNHHWEEKIREMESELDAKKQQLEQERGLAETEKRRLAEEILLKEEEIQKSKDEHQRLAERLAAIEKKVIVGGENMLEKAEKQAQLLEESNRELERVRTNENELRKRLETRQAEHLDIEEKYTSLQEEAAGKTRKLKKVWSSYMQAKAELADMDGEHQREMEGLLDNVRQLQRELKLYSTIVNSYVPPDYLKLIEKHVYWNEDIGDWQLKCIAYTGNNMREAKFAPPMMYRNGDLQLKQPYLSYADILEQPAVPQQIANTNRNTFRPKSAKKDRNAARIKALLE
uniref:Kinesin-like protein n=1 Tax=Panagrellus redivivus TaxID=6233 RepID=A0A7E4VXP5_PANRE